MIIADYFFRSLEVSPILQGSMKAIFRRVELFHEALVFMILRGDKTLLAGYNFTPKESLSQPPQLITGTFFPFIHCNSLMPTYLARQPFYQPTILPSTPSRKFKNGREFSNNFGISQANFLSDITSQINFTSPPSSQVEKSPMRNASQGIFSLPYPISMLISIILTNRC